MIRAYLVTFPNGQVEEIRGNYLTAYVAQGGALRFYYDIINKHGFPTEEITFGPNAWHSYRELETE